MIIIAKSIAKTTRIFFLFRNNKINIEIEKKNYYPKNRDAVTKNVCVCVCVLSQLKCVDHTYKSSRSSCDMFID